MVDNPSRLFDSLRIGMVSFTVIEGATAQCQDGIVHHANLAFANTVGRSQEALNGVRLGDDIDEQAFQPMIAAAKIAGELRDVVKTTVEIGIGGEEQIFDVSIIASGNVFRAAFIDVTDIVWANRSLERRLGELRFNNDALESQAAELTRLAEEIEEARQSLDKEVERRTKLERELRRLAHFDELTGVANRRSFLNEAQAVLDKSAPDRKSVMILLDIDHFKKINDSYGHGAGDDVLRAVSKLISAEVDGHDIMFGRIGGEEFALMMPNAVLADGVALAEWIRICIAKSPITVGDAAIPVTVSLGVSERRDDETDLTQLIARADVALYAAKASGRNTVYREDEQA